MAAALGLRLNFDGAELRRLARSSRDAKQVRRLLALAAIYDGAPRSEAARIAGVMLQIVRDWVVRFNTEGPGGLIDRNRRGALHCSVMINAARWSRSSRPVRSPRRTGWYVTVV
ncbi:MAG: helix-turn-helix domain-containing protein [Hyphomicrobiales bacterium]|nr:MAG: helix-turn-helix domain-containing protein [Hyphomicrobiales bacterium]